MLEFAFLDFKFAFPLLFSGQSLLLLNVCHLEVGRWEPNNGTVVEVRPQVNVNTLIHVHKNLLWSIFSDAL